VDPIAWLDAIFGDDGSGASSTQGSPRLNQGFASVAGWMVGQSFADAGPVGQYIGMLYGSPGTGIPSVTDVTPQAGGGATFARRGGDYGTYDRGGYETYDRGGYLDFTQEQVFRDAPDYGAGAQPVKTSDEPSQPGESRTLEVLDGGAPDRLRRQGRSTRCLSSGPRRIGPEAPGAPGSRVFSRRSGKTRPPAERFSCGWTFGHRGHRGRGARRPADRRLRTPRPRRRQSRNRSVIWAIAGRTSTPR